MRAKDRGRLIPVYIRILSILTHLNTNNFHIFRNFHTHPQRNTNTYIVFAVAIGVKFSSEPFTCGKKPLVLCSFVTSCLQESTKKRKATESRQNHMKLSTHFALFVLRCFRFFYFAALFVEFCFPWKFQCFNAFSSENNKTKGTFVLRVGNKICITYTLLSS